MLLSTTLAQPGPSSRIPTLSEARHANQKAAFPLVKVAISVQKNSSKPARQVNTHNFEIRSFCVISTCQEAYFRILFETVTYFISSQYISQSTAIIFVLILLRKNRSEISISHSRGPPSYQES